MAIVKPQTPNLIETINAGYAVLNRRLWILLIPVALNVYLWLGARLSLSPLLQNLNRLGEPALLFPADAEQQAQVVETLRDTDMRAPLALLNVVPVLPPDVFRQNTLSSESVIAVSHLLDVLGFALVINLCTLLISSIFLVVLANSILNQPSSFADWVRWVAKAILDLIGCGAIVLGVIMLLSLPFLVISAIIVSFLPGLAPVILILWITAGFWVYVYAGFSVEAVMLSEVGPLRAIYNSVNVVRRNLITTLGLIAVSLVITLGLNVIWSMLAVSHWGLLLAILGSAYIGSGLAAARLVFYHERVLRWRLLEHT